MTAAQTRAEGSLARRCSHRRPSLLACCLLVFVTGKLVGKSDGEDGGTTTHLPPATVGYGR